MGDLWLFMQDYMYWIVHIIGLYIVWDISNSAKCENTLLNTPVSYFLIGVTTTQIASWFDNLPRG